MKRLLLVLAGCGRFGFDERMVDALPPIDARPPEVYRVDVLLYPRMDVCMVGNNCTVQPCFTIENDATAVVQSIASNTNLRGVVPNDPAIAGAQQSRCMALTLDAGELAEQRQNFTMLATNVNTWTRGELELDLQFHEITGSSTLTRYMDMVWVDNGDLPPGIVTTATDFLFAVQDVRDDMTALHYNFKFCSLRYGAGQGPSGTSYSWFPRAGAFAAFECAAYDAYRGHFLLQLFDAYLQMLGPTYAVTSSFPACGTSVDPTSYFPDPSQCQLDPDFSMCGATTCDEAAYHQHILEKHWVRGKVPALNHCRNGIMDVGETDIDIGGNCP
jgi:hypothetical protein